MIILNVLVACEESQVVCSAYRSFGHNAFSCDLQPCSGGHPEWHIQGDCLPLINGHCIFETMDGCVHVLSDPWDLLIAHPPCTRLCNSGQRWLYYGDQNYRDQKLKDQKLAIDFFMLFVNADCPRIAIENPVGIMSSVYRKPDCIYNPYDFVGESECKRTALWLKGLPPLQPTQEKPAVVTRDIWRARFNGKQYAWSDPLVAKFRSKTPLGVAAAMASQWSF